MNLKSVVNNRILGSISAFLITLLFVLWEYFSGGVVSHNLLARADMPAFSNWWGLLTVPLLFWISIYFINKRQAKGIESGSTPEEYQNEVLKRFLAALAFGLLMSILWEFNFQQILQYLILLPIVIAFSNLFIYRNISWDLYSECFSRLEAYCQFCLEWYYRSYALL